MIKSSVFLAIFVVVLLIEWCPFAFSQGLIGGPRDIDINTHDNARNALNYAVDNHNKGTKDMCLRDVSEVLRAQIQVVAGLKYTFIVNMARTNCTKHIMNEVCVVHQEPEYARAYECAFSVWSRPWLDSTIVEENCTNEKSA